MALYQLIRVISIGTVTALLDLVVLQSITIIKQFERQRTRVVTTFSQVAVQLTHLAICMNFLSIHRILHVI